MWDNTMENRQYYVIYYNSGGGTGGGGGGTLLVGMGLAVVDHNCSAYFSTNRWLISHV